MLSNSARSLGIFREQWLTGYYRLRRPALAAWYEARVEQQQIITVRVEKLGNLWLRVDLPSLLERALVGKLTAAHGTVLSPFDPVVWGCRRTEQLFDFSYRLKCYTPALKRQYNCFVLPLSHHGQLVRRMDVKVHRQTGILEVISLWLQKNIKPTTMLQKGLRRAVTDFTSWQQATQVTLGRYPQGLFTDYRTGWEIDPVA